MPAEFYMVKQTMCTFQCLLSIRSYFAAVAIALVSTVDHPLTQHVLKECVCAFTVPTKLDCVRTGELAEVLFTINRAAVPILDISIALMVLRWKVRQSEIGW